LPVEIRGQVIGTIRARKATPDEEWTREEMAVMETLTGQLEQALESARLYRDTQATAERERLVGEVTARIRGRLEMEAMLKTAAQEIRQALNLPELTVRLTPDETSDGNGRE
jgi:GAF domain-containing protein